MTNTCIFTFPLTFGTPLSLLPFSPFSLIGLAHYFFPCLIMNATCYELSLFKFGIFQSQGIGRLSRWMPRVYFKMIVVTPPSKIFRSFSPSLFGIQSPSSRKIISYIYKSGSGKFRNSFSFASQPRDSLKFSSEVEGFFSRNLYEIYIRDMIGADARDVLVDDVIKFSQERFSRISNWHVYFYAVRFKILFGYEGCRYPQNCII